MCHIALEISKGKVSLSIKLKTEIKIGLFFLQHKSYKLTNISKTTAFKPNGNKMDITILRMFSLNRKKWLSTV